MDDVGTTMDKIWWDRPFTLTGLDIGAGHATLHVLTSYSAARPSNCAPTKQALSTGSRCRWSSPSIKNVEGHRRRDLPRRVRSTHIRCRRSTTASATKVAGTNTDLSLPLASIFKLYVLLAVSESVKAGTVSWDDQLTVTKEGKLVGAAGLDEVPNGTHGFGTAPRRSR